MKSLVFNVTCWSLCLSTLVSESTVSKDGKGAASADLHVHFNLNPSIVEHAYENKGRPGRIYLYKGAAEQDYLSKGAPGHVHQNKNGPGQVHQNEGAPGQNKGGPENVHLNKGAPGRVLLNKASPGKIKMSKSSFGQDFQITMNDSDHGKNFKIRFVDENENNRRGQKVISRSNYMQVWGWKEIGGEKDPREKTALATYDGEEVSSFMITSHVLFQGYFSC